MRSFLLGLWQVNDLQIIMFISQCKDVEIKLTVKWKLFILCEFLWSDALCLNVIRSAEITWKGVHKHFYDWFSFGFWKIKKTALKWPFRLFAVEYSKGKILNALSVWTFKIISVPVCIIFKYFDYLTILRFPETIYTYCHSKLTGTHPGKWIALNNNK